MNPLFFNEVTDFASQIVQQKDAPFKVKINPLVRSIGFLESLDFMRKLLSQPGREGHVYFDYMRHKGVKNEYHKAMKYFLDDFKAKTRQYAKR